MANLLVTRSCADPYATGAPSVASKFPTAAENRSPRRANKRAAHAEFPRRRIGVVAIGYAVPRFFLDFLRREASDPRYHGLTPAQWSCLATVAAAAALFAWIYMHPEPPPGRYLDAPPWRLQRRDAFRIRRRPAGAT